MTVHRVPATSPYQRPFRILGGGAIVLFLGVWLFSIYEPEGVGDSTNKIVGMTAGALLIGAVAAAFTLSGKIGIWTLKRASQWELDEERILRRGDDGRTNEIPLTEIKSLRENRGWLLIWGGEPPMQIAIPSEVNDFEELKAKLRAHCGIAAQKPGFSLTINLVPTILGVITYGFLFLSPNKTIVLVSGVVALLLQGVATYFFWRLWRKRQMPKYVMVSLVFSFVVLGWIVYRRTQAGF